MRALGCRGSLTAILIVAALLALTTSRLAAGADEGTHLPFPITTALPDLIPPVLGGGEDETIDPPFPPTALPDLTPPVLGAPEDDASNSHFPRPAALSVNVDFWKRVYTEFGVGDFVLHDRENLAIIYDVVHIDGATNERRAADAAAPEIRRLRVKYEGILTSLAQGVAPEVLGLEGLRVALAWGCPCSSDDLLRAASNIRVQQGLREKVDEGMQRARVLMPQILSVLRRHNLPHELAALPMVESSFNPRARSKAGAVGLWQIIRSTGRRYLSVTRQRDDRRDPIRATDAAARLLKQNYGALGSWPLALLAYNHGKEGVRAAKDTLGSSAVEDIIVHYNGRRFGFASRNFYPEFLAALDLLHPIIHASPHQTRNLKRPPRIAREG
jgi:membrane-bound lytic murein transglycosylase D